MNSRPFTGPLAARVPFQNTRISVALFETAR
jgi:hypothetical protein